MREKIAKIKGNGFPWINPIGGYGDMLMISGVLKLVIEHEPTRRFNLTRRTSYQYIFNGHEAISEVNFPPKNAEMKRVDYWAMEKLGPGIQRPFQVLAREFGLQTPVKEKLYLPGSDLPDLLLHNFIPWKKKNILIAPASDSPRKAMQPFIWHTLVKYLQKDGSFVLQVGRIWEQHIENTYTVKGLTNPAQAISLIKKCDLVITVDNFIMHAAHLAGVPAVVIWGPTQHDIYGYPEQTHIQMPMMCELPSGESCIVSGKNRSGELYGTVCPLGARHCTDQIRPEAIYKAVNTALLKKS